ncbi:hypothetical protein HRbin26_00138 [bacterium HR26]|nr:hypothetical protein HRbin26_00138 [bacterium HR26]
MARRQQRQMPHRRPPKRRTAPSSKAQPEKATAVAPRPAQPSSQGTIASPWGRVDEEYAIIRADLKRLLMITLLILLLLIVLTVFLR